MFTIPGSLIILFENLTKIFMTNSQKYATFYFGIWMSLRESKYVAYIQAPKICMLEIYEWKLKPNKRTESQGKLSNFIHRHNTCYCYTIITYIITFFWLAFKI